MLFRSPNVIRLIRAFPIYKDTARLVALQLARGPNLQRVVSKRGALGLPLSRLVCRQLIAAVSYLHGRAVLHRDIKPTNCILENTELPPNQYYDYTLDNSIWSDGVDAQEAVEKNKWKVMLVDFGFARALEEKEYKAQAKPMRNSILFERSNKQQQQRPAPLIDGHDQSDDDSDSEADLEEIEKAAAALRRESIQVDNFAEMAKKRASYISALADFDETERDDEEDNVNVNNTNSDKPPETATQTSNPQESSPSSSVNNNNNKIEESIPESDTVTTATGAGATSTKASSPSSSPPPPNGGEPRRASFFAKSNPRDIMKRQSTTKTKIRSMSALGTKAYAAPEIKHKLRNKTTEDLEKKNAALTECVADYGMIVDAYSVGWTLRVIMTGVPPNSTISQYLKKIQEKEMEEEMVEMGCCCFGGGGNARKDPKPAFRVRDTDEIPKAATLFITALTKPNPEERMSVREAQNHPWVRGSDKEALYEVPQGDIPSHHGDPVVPLSCAGELSRIVEEHHQ